MMDGTCSMHGEIRYASVIVVGKPDEIIWKTKAWK
jgi:hypothetical protein